MKKIVLSALAIAGLISCNKEDVYDGSFSGDVLNLTVNTADLMESAPDTKTVIAFDQASGQYIPTWTESDKLAVWVDNIPVSGNVAPAFLTNAQAGTKASFNGQVEVSAGSHVLYGYASTGYSDVQYSAEGVIFQIPALQHPTATSFDPAADLLIAAPFDLQVSENQTDATVNNARFARPFATVNLVLTDGTTGSVLSSADVTSVTLSTQSPAVDPLTGSVTVDMSNAAVSSVASGANVTAEFSSGSPLRINGSNSVFFVVNPLTFSADAQLTVTVVADGLQCVKTIAAGGAKLLAGSVGNISLTLTDEDVLVDMSKVTINQASVTELSDGVYGAVVDLSQNGTLDIAGYAPGFSDWLLDPDYISATGEDGKYNFLPVSGKYKVMLEASDKYIRFERMNADGSDTATLGSDKTGAMWLIGSDCVGKPSREDPINWSTDKALCMSQIEAGKFQITLVAGTQLQANGINFKFYGEKGWGTEFKSANISTSSKLVRIGTDSSGDGNVYRTDGTTLTAGVAYTFVVDLTNAVFADGSWTGAVLSVKINGEDEPVADVLLSAEAASYGYTYKGNISKDNTIEVVGIPDIDTYYFDPDFFSLSNGQYVFNAMSGSYKVDFYSSEKYVRVTRLAADGSYARLADGAIWLMGWGVATPQMSTGQFGWNSSNYCMAEISENVFQFTGKAVGEKDTTVGGRFRYDYISAKYFFFNGYDNGEANSEQITISGNASDLLKLSGSNIELASALTEGATYRLTIDLSDGTVSGSTYTGTERIIFEKLD